MTTTSPMTLAEKFRYREACQTAACLHLERARMYRAAYGADSVLAQEHADAAKLMREIADRIRDDMLF